MTTVLDAARRELQRGRQPIPVPQGQKRAILARWPELRLTHDDLPAHFSGPSNLGILNGAPSGNLVDVDLDCPQALGLADVWLPQTHSVFGRPGKLRSHRLYVADPLPSTMQFQDVDGSMLLEIRSTGSQTLFPPSTHPSGHVLSWDEDGDPGVFCRDELIAQVSKTAAACLLARHWPNTGGRHEAALALAGGLLRLGWSEEDVADFVEAVTEAASDEETRDRVAAARYTGQRLANGKTATGWNRLGRFVSEAVVHRVREWLGAPHSENSEHSATAWEHPIPLTDLPLPPFPTEIFPDWLRAYVDAESVATQTPPDLAAMLALASLATASAKRVIVQLAPDWHEPVNLFTVTAMAPAERKSAVFTHVTGPVEEFEAEEVVRLTPVVAEAEGRRKIAEHALGKAQREAANASGSEQSAPLAKADELARDLARTPIPTIPRLVVDDCSPERLSSLLAEQGGRIAAMAPEGDVFDLMAGRYSTNGTPNFGVYLRGHAGDNLRVDRVGRPAEFVRAPALTMGLAVQPEIIHGLAMRPGFRGRGLLGRFLYSLPPSMLGRRATDPTAVPGTVRRTYHDKMTALLQLEPDTATDMWGQPEPRRLVLSPEAVARFRTIRAELEPRLGELGDLGHIADWAGKLAGAVARIAGLLHMAEYAGRSMPWAVPISDATMRAAIQLGHDYLIPHAQAAFALMGADPAVADARHILRVLADRDMEEFTKRQLFQVVKGRFKTVERLDRSLTVLEEHGYIRARPEPDRLGPGRKPSPTFEVNPLWRHESTQPPDRFAGIQPNGPEFDMRGQTPSQNAHNPQNSRAGDSGPNIEDSGNCEEPVAQQEMMEWTAPL